MQIESFATILYYIAFLILTATAYLVYTIVEKLNTKKHNCKVYTE